MRNINEYKRRFDKLLESTMGNVKPLISEAPEFEEFVVPTLDMLKNHRVTSLNKVLDVKISLNGNEYKITLPEGVYNPFEMIQVQLKIDKKLMISPTRFNSGNTHSMMRIYDIKGDNYELYYYLGFYFYLADNQSVFLDNQPWDGFIEIPCKNVRGGKVRFVVEVPSGSEIYEKPEDVNERDLTRIVRRVINEQGDIYPNQDDQPSVKNKKFNDFLFKLNQTLVDKIAQSFKSIFQTETFLFKSYYDGQNLGIQVTKKNRKDVINLVKMGDAKNSCKIMEKYLQACENLGEDEGTLFSALEYIDNTIFNRKIRTNYYNPRRKDDEKDAKIRQFENQVRGIVDDVVGQNFQHCVNFQ